MVSSLREMNERRQQWLNEKPQFDGSGPDLRLASGDLVIFNFVANGDEGDRFIKVYRSHIIPRVGKEGGRYNETRYCPLQSGETDVQCPLCIQGHTEIKERMSIWMFVRNHLHHNLPKDKQFPGVNYQGNAYYNEEVNGFKIWHSSAWRESPWADILKNAEIYKGLHNFTANLECSGSGTSTRYKLYALPNSETTSKEIYQGAQQECEPIIEILHKQISSNVQVGPQAQQTSGQQSQPANNNIAFKPFTPPGMSLPSLSLGALGNQAASAIPAETPEDVTEAAEEDTPESFTPAPMPTSLTEGEEKRPNRALF